jgi:hypothetical protein
VSMRAVAPSAALRTREPARHGGGRHPPCAGQPVPERYKSSFGYQQLKAFRAILRCRSVALGGHIDVCLKCGHQEGISYNSCRNRSCPKCQAQARTRWLEARQQELLDSGYFHVVFTVPHELNPLALNSPACFYNLLFAASSQTLLELAADPKRLGAEIGFLSICIAGVPTPCTIRMSTVSSPAADSHPTTSAGSIRIRASCCPSRCFVASFATSYCSD